MIRIQQIRYSAEQIAGVQINGKPLMKISLGYDVKADADDTGKGYLEEIIAYAIRTKVAGGSTFEEVKQWETVLPLRTINLMGTEYSAPTREFRLSSQIEDFTKLRFGIKLTPLADWEFIDTSLNNGQLQPTANEIIKEIN